MLFLLDMTFTCLCASSGRVKSSMFMELPNKKDWAIYYQQIKRPMALEMIHVSCCDVFSERY